MVIPFHSKYFMFIYEKFYNNYGRSDLFGLR